MANSMIPVSWSFTTEDATAPVIANWSPTGTGIPLGQDVVFEVTDTGSGVDLTMLYVTIDGVSAVAAGVAQPNYSISTVAIAGGWEVTVGHPDLPSLTTIPVFVSVADVGGNPASQGWSYETADTFAPQVSDNTPTGTGVPVTTDVSFKITDVGAGVDPDSIVVYIGGILAYDGTTGFQAGFQGLNSAVTVIAGGYQIVIDKQAEYAGLTSFLVSVDAQDLQAPPNVMTTFNWSFETQETSGPEFTDKFPAPSTIDVALDTNVSFRVTDVSGVDDATIDVSIGGQIAVLDGVAKPGYGLTLNPIANGYEVIIDPDDLLLLDEDYQVTAEASDTFGFAASTAWQFTTETGLIVTPVLSASAGDGLVNLAWALPPADVMRQERYDLRRSRIDYPTEPTEGDLVYQGLDSNYQDLDVVNGVTYYYTIFVLRKPGEYVPYDVQASDNARPRYVAPRQFIYSEYVPVRGDFGARTFNPLPGGRTTKAWGQGSPRRQSDMVSVPANRVVQSPVRGVVRSVEVYERNLKTIEVEMSSGLVVYLSGILANVARNDAVEAGQAIGRTVGGDVELGIYKLAGETTGRMTVRPRYFYLTVEKRDGRG